MTIDISELKGLCIMAASVGVCIGFYADGGVSSCMYILPVAGTLYFFGSIVGALDMFSKRTAV